MAFLIDGVGPTVVRTFTFPDANATMLTSAAAVTAAQGGTGQTSYAVGDLLYASGAAALSKLADVAVGSVLVSGGVATAPAWSATPSVTSLTASTVLAAGTNPSTTGALRIPNDAYVGWRNAANNGDYGIKLDSANDFSFTIPSGSAVYPSFDNQSDLGSATNRWRAGYFGTALAVGTNPATGGSIRLPNAALVMARNGANSADLHLMSLNAGNLILLGDTGASLQFYAGFTIFGSGGTSAFPALRRNGADLEVRLADDSAQGRLLASAFGDTATAVRMRSSLATPGSLADGDWWVDVSGVSPARTAAIKVRDGGVTRTIASVVF